MTEPLLWTAAEAGKAIGVTAATFRRMVDQGRVPACIQHKSTFGQERCRRYSRHLLELWAAGVDIENTDPVELSLTVPAAARHLPAGGRAAPLTPLSLPEGAPRRPTPDAVAADGRGRAPLSHT